MAWRYGLKRQMWGDTVEGYQVIEVFDFDRPAIQRSWCETSAYSDSMNEMLTVLDRMKKDIVRYNIDISTPDVVEDLELKMWWWDDAPAKVYPSEEV
jgi:hypothetical protein